MNLAIETMESIVVDITVMMKAEKMIAGKSALVNKFKEGKGTLIDATNIAGRGWMHVSENSPVGRSMLSLTLDIPFFAETTTDRGTKRLYNQI